MITAQTTKSVYADKASVTQEYQRLPQVSWWSLESHDEIIRVLKQAADDPAFIAQLTDLGSEALTNYHLDDQEKAAIVSGDVRWLESHVGKLDERLKTWLYCRLGQEIW